jgi:ankyrin repeat domain-containing protein 50
MWCHGIPGAGKTYLSSIVVHELQQHCELSGDITLVVYCRYDDPQCQSIANIAGDLLRQCIGSRQMPEVLSKLFREHHSSAGTRPTCDALFALLSEHLGLYGKAYIIVDALDEIASADDRKLFVDSLRSIKANVSLLTMSRDFEDIRSYMGLESYLCDCCDSNDCSHYEERPQYVEYLYHCGECIDPKNMNPYATISFYLCQRCYEAGVRCLGQGHPMERMPNFISYDVVPDQNDLKRYLNWRIPSDSSLKMLMGKRKGLQDQVFDAVVRSSGAMSVDTLFPD